MNQTYTTEQRRLKMTEKLWLYYFNDILCRKMKQLNEAMQGSTTYYEPVI